MHVVLPWIWNDLERRNAIRLQLVCVDTSSRTPGIYFQRAHGLRISETDEGEGHSLLKSQWRYLLVI